MSTKKESPVRMHDNCCSCMSRRRCVGLLSVGALGLTMGAPGFTMGTLSRRTSQKSSNDYVDVTKLRPKPKVRIVYAVLEQPRPYWLGWPGTTYDLDGHQREYRSKLDDSCLRLGINADCETKPINNEADFTALISRVKENKPDGLVITLQHMSGWTWLNKIAKDLSVPLIVFAPVGTTFVGHVGISRLPGVYVASTLEWQAVEDGLQMIKAKRMFEETRILHIRGNLT